MRALVLLEHTTLVSSPTHSLVAVLAKCLIWIGFGKHVSWLVFAVNCIDRNFAPINVVSEVVILNTLQLHKRQIKEVSCI